MATKTAGTLATTTLTAIQYSPDPNVMSYADQATVAGGIRRSGNAWTQIFPGAFERAGLLYIPGHHDADPLVVRPGDWVANDGFGNAFLIPQRAMPKTLTATCTGTAGSPAVTSATDLRTLGWQNGTHITSTHTPTGSVIGDMAPDGKSFNLYAFSTGLKVNSTGGAGAETFTAGTFTHS